MQSHAKTAPDPLQEGDVLSNRLNNVCDCSEHAVVPMQETAPAPLSKNVTVVTSPKQQFYVSVFGGFATGGSTLNAALRLALALKTDGKEFDSTQFYYGLYESPTRLFGRHNEIFFIPLSDSTSTEQQ